MWPIVMRCVACAAPTSDLTGSVSCGWALVDAVITALTPERWISVGQGRWGLNLHELTLGTWMCQRLCCFLPMAGIVGASRQLCCSERFDGLAVIGGHVTGRVVGGVGIGSTSAMTEHLGERDRVRLPG